MQPHVFTTVQFENWQSKDCTEHSPCCPVTKMKQQEKQEKSVESNEMQLQNCFGAQVTMPVANITETTALNLTQRGNSKIEE